MSRMENRMKNRWKMSHMENRMKNRWEINRMKNRMQNRWKISRMKDRIKNRRKMSRIRQIASFLYLVGSSKKIKGGLLTSSKAMATRFLCPPDTSLSRVSDVSRRPRFTRISLI